MIYDYTQNKRFDVSVFWGPQCDAPYTKGALQQKVGEPLTYNKSIFSVVMERLLP